MIFDVPKNFFAVGVNFIAGELFDTKIFPFSERKQNSRDDQRLFVFAELPIIAQVLMKNFCAA